MVERLMNTNSVTQNPVPKPMDTTVEDEELGRPSKTQPSRNTFFEEPSSPHPGHSSPNPLPNSPQQTFYDCTSRQTRGDVSSVQTIAVNQILPPKFDGERSAAKNWISEYDSIMDANGYNEQQKLIRARAFMSGPGRDWYVVTTKLDPNITWRSFINRFLLDFCGPDAKEELRRKLENCYQRSGEHPTAFAMRILSLCHQYDPNMVESDQTIRIIRGLDVQLRNILAAQRAPKDWTVQELRDLFARQTVTGDVPVKPLAKPSQPKVVTKATLPPGDAIKPRNLESWECFNCGKKGHKIEDCSEPRDEEKLRERSNKYKAEMLSKRSPNKVQGLELTRLNKAQLPCDYEIRPYLTIKLNGKDVEGWIDSGADMTVIPSDVAETLCLNILPWNQPDLVVANSSSLTPMGIAPVLVLHNEVSRPLLVAVISSKFLAQTLWGIDLLRLFSMKLDFGAPSSSVVVNDKGERKLNSAEIAHPINQIQFGNLDVENKKDLEDVLIKFGDTFSRNEYDIGRTSLIKHRINLVDDKPVHKPPYRTPVRERATMDEILERNKATGAIRTSKSPYASPVFLVSKDHGKDKRLVADYRALNSKTIPDRQPMPHPEDVFLLLRNKRIFAKLDITSMFNQIEVDERDVAKTAIITPSGLFECPLMPFGLMNAPATAVRLMREVLRGLTDKICYVYFDDIIVFAENLKELIANCESVLSRLREHNLKLKPSKCTFGVETVNFLGHVISARGVDVDPRRIEHVKNFRIPTSPSDVRSFLGLCSYNRKFIKDFAKIAKPLTTLTGKLSDFEWNTEAQAAFEKLRDALIAAPTLVHFNPDAEHELRTDASSYAMGAVLYQKHSEANQTGVVLYYSKTLNAAQRNYSATGRELLAAHDSIMSLAHFLIGKRFTLVTDHAALSLLHNQKDPHQRLARWVAQLQAFDFEVVHKPGSAHLDADCLSRLVKETSPLDKDHDANVGINFIRAINAVSGTESVASQQEEATEDDSLPNMHQEQRNDQYCKQYIDILESDSISEPEKRRRARNFTIQDGLLHRDIGDDKVVLVVPARRRAAVLLSCHDAPLAGHLGFARTFAIVRDRFYWPKMRKDIKKHVNSCLGCQRRKPLNTRRQGLTQPLPIAEDVFDTLGIDLISKLPRSYSGHNAILVCTDNLSKYVITVPLKDESSDSVLHGLFNYVIAKHGCPRLVISDRGSNLCGEKSRDFFKLFGIKRALTSAFHPETNGQTERFNRTLAIALTNYVEREQRNWSDFLQALTFAYNTSEHSVTRLSPYELVFGKRPRIPIDNLLSRNDFINPGAPFVGSSTSESIRLMKNLIIANQQANKRRLDKRLSQCTFKEGDLVLVERPTRIRGAVHKLSFTYIGPFSIKRKLGELSFEIASSQGRTFVAHPCHLKRYIPREGDVADELVEPNFVPKEQVLPDPDEETDSCDGDEVHDPLDVFDPLNVPPALSPHGLEENIRDDTSTC